MEQMKGPSKQISRCVRGQYNAPWPTWKKIPDAIQKNWFTHDFRAHFRWLLEHEREIRQAFDTRGSSTVKNAMNKIRDNKDKGDWLRLDVIQGLRDYWATDEEFLHRSMISKQNRAAESGAPLYTGGSVSIPGHHKRLTKA